MTPDLQAKLQSAIDTSRVFKLMPLEAQQEFSGNLENASDEQALQAIAVLQKHEEELVRSEAAQASNTEALAAAVAQLNQEIKTADKFIAKQDEADDQATI
jgi:hypothetical protein